MSHRAQRNVSAEIANFIASGQQEERKLRQTFLQPVSQINANASLAQSVTASNVGGKLVLTAAQFGSAYNFTVSSSQAATFRSFGTRRMIRQQSGMRRKLTDFIPFHR